jgi:hypothetical protein
MEQTKLGSLIESGMNIVIGYGVALISQLAVFPMFGIHVPFSTTLWIGAWFTVISLVRSYIIRRWFNARMRSAANSMAIAARGGSSHVE